MNIFWDCIPISNAVPWKQAPTSLEWSLLSWCDDYWLASVNEHWGDVDAEGPKYLSTLPHQEKKSDSATQVSFWRPFLNNCHITPTSHYQICFSNVYHPPPAVLNVSLLSSASDQCITSGDFNCRHENWGYPDSNQNDNLLADWSCTNNPHTLYDPKQPASFQSARWNSGTNPDATISTQIRGIILTKEVLEQFLHSQHRPSLIRTMPLISFTRSAPIPRWNFRKADWERF